MATAYVALVRVYGASARAYPFGYKVCSPDRQEAPFRPIHLEIGRVVSEKAFQQSVISSKA